MKYNGVWNLSADQGNLGQFIITNVRIVWFATLTESFNVSLPWVQIKCLRIRESKYGIAIVLETSEFSGGYVLGFRVENVDQIYDELSSLFKICQNKPSYGVQCFFEDAQTNIDLITIVREEDKMDIVDTGYEHVRSIQNTYATNKKENNDESTQIQFNDDLGLACEALPDDVSIDMLWRIV